MWEKMISVTKLLLCIKFRKDGFYHRQKFSTFDIGLSHNFEEEQLQFLNMFDSVNTMAYLCITGKDVRFIYVIIGNIRVKSW
jgi:hypothetical protein